MVNFIWLFMLVVGVLTAAVTGNIQVIAPAAFAATQQSITIVLEIAGVMMLWMGILALAEKSGLINLLGNCLKPLIKFIFPEIPAYSTAMGAIIMNISANLLGLGNAATPFGIKAMQEMEKLNPNKGIASNSMICFLVLNTSSLTLIPTMVIALRVQAGSANAEEIIMLTIIATICGASSGLLAHKLLKNKS